MGLAIANHRRRIAHPVTECRRRMRKMMLQAARRANCFAGSASRPHLWWPINKRVSKPNEQEAGLWSLALRTRSRNRSPRADYRLTARAAPEARRRVAGGGPASQAGEARGQAKAGRKAVARTSGAGGIVCPPRASAAARRIPGCRSTHVVDEPAHREDWPRAGKVLASPADCDSWMGDA